LGRSTEIVAPEPGTMLPLIAIAQFAPGGSPVSVKVTA